MQSNMEYTQIYTSPDGYYVDKVDDVTVSDLLNEYSREGWFAFGMVGRTIYLTKERRPLDVQSKETEKGFDPGESIAHGVYQADTARRNHPDENCDWFELHDYIQTSDRDPDTCHCVSFVGTSFVFQIMKFEWVFADLGISKVRVYVSKLPADIPDGCIVYAYLSR
jgi:hypothetical protein